MGIHLKKIGHINMKVTHAERAKAFYRDVLGFTVSEEDPDHGGIFMTLGDDFHTLDLSVVPGEARLPDRTVLGVSHVAFQVHSYQALREAYQTLVDHDVTIDHATDHMNQRSLYFADPDGNRLEIYYEMADALKVFPDGRGDRDDALPVTKPGEALPAWLDEEWPKR